MKPFAQPVVNAVNAFTRQAKRGNERIDSFIGYFQGLLPPVIPGLKGIIVFLLIMYYLYFSTKEEEEEEKPFYKDNYFGSFFEEEEEISFFELKWYYLFVAIAVAYVILVLFLPPKQVSKKARKSIHENQDLIRLINDDKLKKTTITDDDRSFLGIDEESIDRQVKLVVDKNEPLPSNNTLVSLLRDETKMMSATESSFIANQVIIRVSDLLGDLSDKEQEKEVKKLVRKISLDGKSCLKKRAGEIVKNAWRQAI